MEPPRSATDMVSKKHYGKANQLALGSEHTYIYILNEVISWGNKMNFSLYVNTSGFRSGSHIFKVSYII